MTSNPTHVRPPDERRLILGGRVVAIVTMLMGLAAVIVWVSSGAAFDLWSNRLQELSGTIIVPVVVLIALPRVPRNGSAWAFAFTGFALGVSSLTSAVAESISGVAVSEITTSAVSVAPADLPLAASIAFQVALAMWIPSFVLIGTLVLLLFPDGRYPSPERRWRWVGKAVLWSMSIGMLAVMWQFRPWATQSYNTLSQSVSVGSVVGGTASMVMMLLVVASIVGYIVKWRRAEGEIRLQYRWVGFAFLLFAVNSIVPIVGLGSSSYIADVITWVLILFIPVSYTVAILKYKLYGIDVVVSRAVSYGLLAAFITGVYALVVVGVGSLLGGSDGSNLLLSIAAVAIVAIAFEPLRRRVQHWANRLVYGKRASPYEVLTTATARLSETTDPDDALAEVIGLVVDGTGATEAVLWLAVGRRAQPWIAVPTDAMSHLHPVDTSTLLSRDGDGLLVVPVRHHGELLGALSLTMGRGESVRQSDHDMLAGVAAGAGVLLRNIGLNAELSQRAEQLRESRRRLVAAHDAERHRLERDLHDGAQQQVVALKVKLGIARTIAEREGAPRIGSLIDDLAQTTQDAVDNMRAVAHGIYPPLLESEGLETALKAARRTVPIPVEIVADGITRHERPIEECVYFAVLGVVTDALDVGAKRAIVSLVESSADITFRIDLDIGPRDLVAVEDRIDAFGGALKVTEEADRTIVTGRVPVDVQEAVPV